MSFTKHLIAASFVTLFASGAYADKPNIVFILTDDLGYGDVNCFGDERCQIETPHFDRLAREGMRFTDAHSIGSVCVPSRVGIMTGRYAWRFGHRGPGGPWGFLGTQLPPGQQTLGTMLQTAGYRTGYVGKWHLGTQMQTTDGKNQNETNVDYLKPLVIGPPQFGFDHSFILPGSLDMYPYVFARDNMWVGQVTAQKGWSAFNRIGPAAEDFEDTKVLGTFCDEAEQFIADSADTSETDQPFFLYLALTSPHTPLSPTSQFEGKSRIGVYGDFVMETDHCIGRMLTALQQNGCDDNTLVIVTSDHGAAPYAGRNRVATVGQLKELEKEGHYASGIYRGYKFSIYEGGFRVPFVVRWPGKVQAAATCDRLIGLHDLIATVAEVANCKLTGHHAVDSISMVPLLKDPKAEAPRSSMIFQGTRAMAIRQGHWKLIFSPGSGAEDRWQIQPGHETAWRTARQASGKKPNNRDELLQPAFVQLYNLTDDPSETTDRSTDHPEQLRELNRLFHEQVDTGRSTPGPPTRNDRANIRAFSAVPPFVWQ